jgi:hypothetical protein
MTEIDSTATASGTVVAGARLGERYTLSRLIGTGGMASVWVAHDPRLHREVAIKIISDTLALDSTFVERFEREARIAAALSHPHVVSAFDYGTHYGRPYLVVEYVAGGTLSARLKEGRTDWDPVTLARELLDALAHIHAVGILHRDLKPANVLFGTDGRARLTDFGIASLADATKLTSTGFVVGTENYLAPEVRGGGVATVASDLYGLGVVLRECATGGAPHELTELIHRLTDPDPQRRPASAEQARAFLTGTAQAPTAPMPVESAAAGPAVLLDAPTEAMGPPTAPAAAPVTGSDGERTARRWMPRGLGLALAVLLVSVLLALSLARHGSSREPLQTPPAGGSVAEQLDQLDNSIDHARR